MSEIVTFSIQSGSNGNCIYVEAGSARLLFDAGVSGKAVRNRMAEHDRFAGDVDALFISHEHSDHIKSAGIYQRMFGVPIYLTEPTLQASRCDLGKLTDVRHFRSGDSIQVKDVVIHTIGTAHDAVDGVAFIVEWRNKRLGIFTDLGHPFSGLVEILASVDAAYLESNYDEQMLETGPYPYYLKQRISGKHGHVSNSEAANLIREVGKDRHRWIALSHLSEENNCPQLAMETYRQIVGDGSVFDVSSRYGVSTLRVV